jgi:hypothetical protein
MANGSTRPTETEPARAGANGVSPHATGLFWGNNLASAPSHTIKTIRRTPPAWRSHLGLVGRWARWARVGGGVGRDCTELGIELG